MKKKIFSLRSLARHLKVYGLSAVWLKAEAEAGRIPCLIVGRRMLFDVEAVEAALLRRAGQEGGDDHAK